VGGFCCCVTFGIHALHCCRLSYVEAVVVFVGWIHCLLLVLVVFLFFGVGCCSCWCRCGGGSLVLVCMGWDFRSLSFRWRILICGLCWVRCVGRWFMSRSFTGCGWGRVGCFVGSVLVHYPLRFAGRYDRGSGVYGWWWPRVGGVCLSDFLYDLCDAVVEFAC
jgi:hypothetical protein